MWHVALTGVTDQAKLDKLSADFVSVRTFDYKQKCFIAYKTQRCSQHRERETLRNIVKHLRQRGLLNAAGWISSQTCLNLEHPRISQLHLELVSRGNWSACETLVQEISDAGLFDSYLRMSSPLAIWRKLRDTDDLKGDTPPARSSHAMCVDQERGILYLHGGWDGKVGLNDFWKYDISEDRWSKIIRSDGETQRFCHQMVFNEKTGDIFILGGAPLGLPDGSHEVSSSAPVISDRINTNLPGPATAPQASSFSIEIKPESAPLQPPSEFQRYSTRGEDAGQTEILAFNTSVRL